MLTKDMILSKNSISLISTGLSINGILKSEETLDIEGKIEGDIVGNIVTIRELGEVQGNIIAKILNIKGKFNGKIKSERLNIAKQADIKGTFEYISMCVEDGAKIEGELKKIDEIKIPNLNKDLKTSKEETQQKKI
ncbi:MAG TPA: polymer-forming cytoskeletal protein [Rickettsiales bacterium]|nr:polymer-forming cytoskeletal protein [Rickettsiales bacterium]